MGNFKLYSRIKDRETILEIWSSSTKHPDSVFCFSDSELSRCVDAEDQTISWLFECASKLIFPYHAYMLATWACEAYEEMMG